MNTAVLSGKVEGKPELLVTAEGRRVLNFNISVESPGKSVYLPIAKFLDPREQPDVNDGDRLLLTGTLKHSRSTGLQDRTAAKNVAVRRTSISNADSSQHHAAAAVELSCSTKDFK